MLDFSVTVCEIHPESFNMDSYHLGQGYHVSCVPGGSAAPTFTCTSNVNLQAALLILQLVGPAALSGPNSHLFGTQIAMF